MLVGAFLTVVSTWSVTFTNKIDCACFVLLEVLWLVFLLFVY